MSIADHFDAVHEAGFGRNLDRLQARRQFEVSLALILALVLALAAIGFGMWHDTASGGLVAGHADASFAGALSAAATGL